MIFESTSYKLIVLNKLIFSGALFLLCLQVSSQTLMVNAGTSTVICPGDPYSIGGTPTVTGGTPPYSYLWSPNTAINSISIANPVVNPSVPTWYYVTVTDDSGYVGIDSVLVNLDPSYAYNAGPDTSICIGDTITLGAVTNSMAGGVSYSWSPATYLSSATAPRPDFTGTVTTTYTLTINSPSCAPKQFVITVTVNPLPVVTVSPDYIEIEEGQSTPLLASGATNYFWTPGGGLSNTIGALTNAEPSSTTMYIAFGEDDNGCVDWDTVTVSVIPNNEIIIYNTFSPNNDGINDYFYIGNILKYPDCRLEVFTRTGQLVYAKTGYDNSWDGTNYGDKLPETVYYYTLDLGGDAPVINGHVTIVR
jgi:gliding motility-associated-like protein